MNHGSDSTKKLGFDVSPMPSRYRKVAYTIESIKGWWNTCNYHWTNNRLSMSSLEYLLALV
jgi:hypothetical protein